MEVGDFKIVDGKYVKLRGGRGCSRSRWDSRRTMWGPCCGPDRGRGRRELL